MKNLLKKFLLIFVIGILTQPCVENTCWGMKAEAEEEYYMDLPDDTPGAIYDKETPYNELYFEPIKDISGKYHRCIKVPIKNFETYIYFPRDARQPTTEDAAKWSCANIDNTEDSPITEWYMKMFGYKQEIKAGYVSGNLEAAIDPNTFILSFAYNNAPNNFERNFWETFRVIASDPVGRVLLYRILIEIRRRSKASLDGVEEISDITNTYLSARNVLRSIKIEQKSNSFEYKTRALSFSFENISVPVINIGDDEKVTLKKEARTADIGLFHEMLHWFHSLRKYSRVNTEYNQKSWFRYFYYGRGKTENTTTLTRRNSDSNISKTDLSDTENTTTLTRRNSDSNISKTDLSDNESLALEEYTKCEEMRTILGHPDYNDDEIFNLCDKSAFLKSAFLTKYSKNCFAVNKEDLYLPISAKFFNGDDLSENAYRVSRYMKNRTNSHLTHPLPSLRFSHTTEISQVNMKTDSLRLKLAYTIAIKCYINITGDKSVKDVWKLEKGSGACYKQ